MRSRPIRSVLSLLGICFLSARLPCQTLADDVALYGREIKGDEMISTLDRISKRVQSNRESIKTWKGKCEYRDSDYSIKGNPTFPENRGTADRYDEFQFPDEKIAQARETFQAKEGYWLLRDGTAEFLLDQQNQKYRVLKQPSDIVDIWDPVTGYKHRRIMTLPNISYTSTPKTYTVLDAVQAVEFSPNYFFTRIPKPGFEDFVFPRARIVFVTTPRSAVHSTSLINLLECFATRNGISFSESSGYFSNFSGKVTARLRGEGSEEEQRLSQEYARLYTTADEPPVVTFVYGKPGRASSVYQFDGKVGYNVTRYIVTVNESPVAWRSIKYAEIDEKFVPSELRYSQIYGEESTVVGAHARTLKIETESVNQPIAATEFELITLGLKYGDRKYDETTKKSFAYDDRIGFVPPEDFKFDPSRMEQFK